MANRQGGKAGYLSASSSGSSFAFGLVVPIVFVAYTEEEACEALAADLGRLLTGRSSESP